MDLSGIVFAALIILVVLGTAAGILIVVNAGDRGQNTGHPLTGRSAARESDGTDSHPPTPQNAWKPETWYSEMADGTLFPNQPSPSFRVSADSSFLQAIARRDREDQASNEPTEPHPVVSRPALPAPSRPLETGAVDDPQDMTESPTGSMPTVPVKDNLPVTLKTRAVQSRHPAVPSPMKTSQPATSPSQTSEDDAALAVDWSTSGTGDEAIEDPNS